MNQKLLIAAIILVAVVAVALYITMGRGPELVRVRVTTTTSLYATGLLDYLADKFKEKYPKVEIDFIAVGSGEALRRAERGDACMVFVHAPSLEKQYMEKGVITGHKIFAYNYFIIVGPPDDPANVKMAENAVAAFRRIYEAGEAGKIKFVSRGDNSGTHVKEMSIWKLAGLDPHGRSWYLESGQGMSQTLVMASELGAYTLSDIGTYLKLKKDGKLPGIELLYSNSTELINIYSIYLVTSCTGKEREYAEKFAEFVYNNQNLIGSYGVNKYGQPLFYPAEGREKELQAAWEMLARG